jgi:hypothetical protein
MAGLAPAWPTQTVDQEQAARSTRKGAGPQHRGPVLNSLFYLPTSIALLFFLAASLLLGLM